jgi:hypothetical protein
VARAREWPANTETSFVFLSDGRKDAWGLRGEKVRAPPPALRTKHCTCFW